jgi:hypothetical protein
MLGLLRKACTYTDSPPIPSIFQQQLTSALVHLPCWLSRFVDTAQYRALPEMADAELR